MIGSVFYLIYMIIALVLLTAVAGALGWRLYRTHRALRRSERRVASYQQDRVIRQNLQNMLDSRNAENKRLRSRLRQQDERLEELEKENSEMKLNLFHENSLRILHDKEDASQKMKLDLMEKQLDDMTRKLREQRNHHQAEEARMSDLLRDQQATIDKLNAKLERSGIARGRRAARRMAGEIPNQVTIGDLFEN